MRLRMTVRQKSFTYILFGFFVAICFAGLTSSYTTDRPIIKDAAQNVRSAYHLVHDGMISSNGSEPQMRREPLPIVAIAALLLVHPDFAEPHSVDDLLTGRLNPSVKLVNALWRFLAAFFIFLLCWELFPGVLLPAMMAVICIALGEVVFFAHPGMVDRLYTEIPASAMLLLASWCAVRFVRTKAILSALFLGVALGALALTKATFLYVSICFIAVLLIMEVVKRLRSPVDSWSRLVSLYAVITLALAAVIAPWVIRNYIEFDQPQIASRGEEVLGVRVLLTEQPLLGTLYASSPDRIKKRYIGPLTGYTRKDLKPGGRLEDLVTAKSRRDQTFALRMQADGFSGDRDEWLRHMAISYISEHPLRYIASIGVFAYKGMWFLGRAGTDFNIVAMLCFLGVFFWSVLSGNQKLFAAFGSGAGLYLFISAFTHALTRYNAPITPLVIIANLWLLVAIVRRILQLPRAKEFTGRLRTRVKDLATKRA